jgi:hypothetical protein
MENSPIKYQEAALNKFLNEGNRSSIWEVVETRDRKCIIVLHKPTGLKAKAMMWDPFKWVINRPSITELN